MCGIGAAATGTPSSMQVATTSGGGLGTPQPPMPADPNAAPASVGTGYDAAPLAALAQGVDALARAVARLGGAAGPPPATALPVAPPVTPGPSAAAPAPLAPGDGLRRWARQDAQALQGMQARADANAQANGGAYSPSDVAAIQQRTHQLAEARDLVAFFDAHPRGVTSDVEGMASTALAHSNQSGGTFIPEELAQIRATVLANEQRG